MYLREIWFLEQRAKSDFFLQKLHNWKLLIVAKTVEAFNGEDLQWNLSELGISQAAWNRVIHRGIKPVTVFAHPEVLMQIRGSVGYYRMLSMVSQKSMIRVGLAVGEYEKGKSLADKSIAQQISYHLNQIISHLVERDQRVSKRELDLWRGMAAGAQAQGSWQNAKGSLVEDQVKELIRQRLHENGMIKQENANEILLSDDRSIVFADEPDIAFYDKNKEILVAIEVKGGIDSAGVLERLGAAMKSLSRARSENQKVVTILIIRRTSLTQKFKKDLELNKQAIDYWFVFESLLNNSSILSQFFEVIKI